MCYICAMKGGSSEPHLIGSLAKIAAAAAKSKVAPAFVPSTKEVPVAANVKTLIEGYSWTGTTGQAKAVTYSFSQANGPSDYYGLTGKATMNATQQSQAEAALQAWANVANVTFTEVSGTADINMRVANMPSGIAGWMAPSVYSATQLAHADIVMDHDYANMQMGTYAFMAIMHEIGHALGLKHPGNYNGSGKGSGPFLAKNLDSHDYSIMSYYDGKYTNSWNHNPTTPMLLDIAAMQFIYGKNTSYNAGDTTYNFTGGNFVLTIWDGAGNDTINASGTSSNNIIDLREGLNNVNTIGSTHMWIAFGANIENATGGSGKDTIYGNAFNNVLNGGGGNDTIIGDKGNDTIIGGSGANLLNGGDGNDTFMVTGADTVLGLNGNDVIDASGSSSTTRLDGGAGTDNITGGLGNDYILGGLGRDTVDAGDGNNTVDGGNDNDDITTGAGNDSVLGGAGNDTVSAGDGNNTVYGGAGNDVVSGGIGADRVYGDAGNDTISSGAGNDTVDGGAGNDFLNSGVGDDSLIGNAGNDWLIAGDGNDTLNGGIGNDVLQGGDGNDTFLSDAGNDTFTGGAGGDIFTFMVKSGKDTITDFEGAGDALGDIIRVSKSIYSSVDTLMNFVSYSNGNALISLGSKNGSITLVGVSNGLTNDDFAIV